MTFRQDINGLRAIAVLAVVFYHFNITVFKGGFVGVDIFFVISGFLMTGIIFNGIEKNTFSLRQFYFNRARRIIPPLAAVCFSLLIIGWLLLLQDEYRALAKHIVRSLSFVSNISYASDSGYFSAATHEKWLLHTWSLSVEWQFYILYPLLILTLRKFLSVQASKFGLLILALLSLLLCITLTESHPNNAFFGLQTRAWEMLAGSLIYLYPISFSKKHTQFFYAIGLALIFYSIFSISAEDAWPGSLAIIPVVGTAFVIAASNEKSFLLNNALSQWLGRVSYSVYLWHWPIVVAIHNFTDTHTKTWSLIGILISLMLGYLSHRYIESAKLFNRREPTRYAKLKFITPILLILVTAQVIDEKKGVSYRITPKAQLAELEAHNKNPHRQRCTISKGLEHPQCIIGDKPNKLAGIVIGDSHADALFTAVLESMPPNYGHLLFLAYDSCLTIPEIKLRGAIEGYQCKEFLDVQFKQLSSQYPGVPLIVINRTPVYVNNQSNPLRVEREGPLAYFDEPSYKLTTDYLSEFKNRYTEAMCTLAQHRPVYITMPTPEMGTHVPKAIARQLMYSDKGHISIPTSDYLDDNAFIRNMMKHTEQQCGTQLLDPFPILCDKEKCAGDLNGKPLYYDGDHLSEFGNKLLIPLFKTIWKTDSA